MEFDLASYGLGALSMFFGLYALSFVMHPRSGRESSVTVHHPGGRTSVKTATRRPKKTADGVNRSGENSVEAVGENVHAVVRQG